MADKDKFLATFRINQDEWKDFMAQAKTEGSSASAVLVDFIQWYRTGNRIAADTKSSTNLNNLTVLIDERIKAKLNQLVERGSQPHPANLDNILDERDRHLESRILSILETMLETKLDDKLEELQNNIRNIESTEDNRIEKLELSHPAAPLIASGDGGTVRIVQVEVEAMQMEKEQLRDRIEELQRENVSIVQRNFELQRENESLLQQNQVLQEELNNLSQAPAISLPDLQLVRDRVLKSLTSGKSKVATTSPQYKTAARALDRFIEELQKYTPTSTPASSTPDGTAAPLVDEATKKLSDFHYTKVEYYAELRQITERCGYRLFIDTTTLGRGRELFIVNPPSNSNERIISTQDVGEVVDWLRKQDREEYNDGQ
ncbi:hypothetical protein [Iningainema tapete]|uniref:Uncharacterized protein n=1 Tax=Iningainema tapete BLCC-T55 TaxID=2748662 RepID=A0A8J6XA73_9CYAN|nr:hypothetical protein [Iningainema tapete]MBD2770975.1 hypothetical protein [Iningainema tapete BLCC-T55]